MGMLNVPESDLEVCSAHELLPSHSTTTNILVKPGKHQHLSTSSGLSFGIVCRHWSSLGQLVNTSPLRFPDPPINRGPMIFLELAEAKFSERGVQACSSTDRCCRRSDAASSLEALERSRAAVKTGDCVEVDFTVKEYLTDRV